LFEHILPYNLLHVAIRAVEQTMWRDSWNNHNTNNMIYGMYVSSEKEAALGLPQLGVKFLADSNS